MDNKQISIPYVAHEASVSRLEKTNKRMFILCIILIAALIFSNVAWIVYEMQFETVEEIAEEYDFDVIQDGENGNNNFVGRDGGIVNGETAD